ncbi:S-adenosyl-L-methionine-dependent methyltransferase [Lizonia empirigonia]|nr:S-adenosyl-L-methionine-dependent methyltransferase [Lizonia empirigonia]
MSTFAKATFSATRYAASRPAYPTALYEKVLGYHEGRRRLCVDLGTGHGLIPRFLASSFDHAVGLDPSAGMVAEAKERSKNFANLRFLQSSAEHMPMIADNSVDMVTAGQAAHWFNHTDVFQELQRILRPQGTLAYWGYKDHVLMNSPIATKVLNDYAYGKDHRFLGSYWGQPGRSIVQDLLRSVHPPPSNWADVTRIEYEPGGSGRSHDPKERLMFKRMRLGEMEEYIRTWSSVHSWQLDHPDKLRIRDGGEGDVVDEMMEAMVASDPSLQGNGTNWQEILVDVEWGSYILLARRK